MTLFPCLTGMSFARRRIFAGLLIAVRNGALCSAGAGIEPPVRRTAPNRSSTGKALRRGSVP